MPLAGGWGLGLPVWLEMQMGCPGKEDAAEGASNLCIKSPQTHGDFEPHMCGGDSKDSVDGRLKELSRISAAANRRRKSWKSESC